MTKMALITEEQIKTIELALNFQLTGDLYRARTILKSLKVQEPIGEIRSVIWGGMCWSVGFVASTKPELKTPLYAGEQHDK